jgi:hypothetical protein
LTEDVLSALFEKTKHEFLKRPAEYAIICKLFGKSQLQGLLELKAGDDDEHELADQEISVTAFKAMKTKNVFDEDINIRSTQNDWYHHCSVCDRQYATRGSVIRHLKRHARDLSEFDTQFPVQMVKGRDISSYDIQKMQAIYPRPIPCIRLMCLVRHHIERSVSSTPNAKLRPSKRSQDNDDGTSKRRRL